MASKVRWGGGVTAQGIDSVDTSRRFTPYEGPIPPPGVYRWWMKILRITESSNKNDQIMLGLQLTPRSDMPEQKRYKGYWQVYYIPVMDGTSFRVREFTDMIGVSGKDFISSTVEDDPKTRNIMKIGRWVNTGKLIIPAALGWGEYKGKERMEITQLIPASAAGEADSDGADDGADDTTPDDEPPF